MKLIINKFIALFLSVLSIMFFVSPVKAEQYGQGVVLGGAQDELVHSTVDAGLAENLAIVGFIFIIFSGLSFYSYKKTLK